MSILQATLAAVAISACASTQATEWVVVWATPKNTSSVSPSSLKESDGVKKMWVSISFPEPRDMNGRPYDTIRQYTHISCKDETYGIKSQLMYKGDGPGDTAGSIVSESVRMEPAPPDSLAATWVAFACDAQFRANAIRLHRQYNR